MFIRRNRRTQAGTTYEYFTLNRTVRTAKGPRQEIVANLGKDFEPPAGALHGWDDIDRLLDGAPPKPFDDGKSPTPAQAELDPEFSAPTTPNTSATPRPVWTQVDLGALRVERTREFGQVYLGLALWRRLGLHTVLRQIVETGRETVPWDITACILTIARFCGNKSELEVAEHWYRQSALEDLLGVKVPQINEARLYRGLDALLPHKDGLCQHLLQRYQTLFGVEFEFLLYDVTSTYFEGKAEGNPQAQRGYSRDQRSDCKQVNIGLVVTPDGLPMGYEVFAGNTTDVTTVEQMVEQMERKYGQAHRIWVMDRGMISEANLAFLRRRNARYIVGTPKAQMRQFEKELQDKEGWTEVQPGVEVRLVKSPQDKGEEAASQSDKASNTNKTKRKKTAVDKADKADTPKDDELTKTNKDEPVDHYLLCRSSDRQAKEEAMLTKRLARATTALEKLHASLQKKPTAVDKAERRIGRIFGKHSGSAKLLVVELQKDAHGAATGLTITKKAGNQAWAELSNGAYLLRTNCPEADPAKVWKWYIQLTKAEECFRISKSDMSLRPVYHQSEKRVQAHIFVCFLTLALWRTLEMWMKSKGLGDCARQLIEDIAQIRSMDVVVPAKVAGKPESIELTLRVVSRPEKPTAFLLDRLGLELPHRPKFLQNVV
jgi:transposase